MAKTVLIIEDDENTRIIFAKALSHRGYRVLTASQGAEGVHLARTQRPDLILLDIRMPVMDGWSALSYLRSLFETKGIPICAISAHTPAGEDGPEWEGLGFDCFLYKPLDQRTLVAQVESQIGPAGEGVARGGRAGETAHSRRPAGKPIRGNATYS